MWMLGSNSGAHTRVTSALITEPSLQPRVFDLFLKYMLVNHARLKLMSPFMSCLGTICDLGHNELI